MTASLTVSWPELARGFMIIKKLVKKPGLGEAVFSFRDGELQIALGGLLVGAPADGNWQGTARVDGPWVVTVARTQRWEPGNGRLLVRVHEGALHLGPLSTPCAWDTCTSEPILLPINPSLSMVLALPLAHSPEEIMRSGLSGKVQQAERRRDRLIEQAVAILGPLGVRGSDLRGLVDECVKRSEGL